ncbi:WD-40 repeat protein [Reticulomyxa filosa]|uniref:WD-40 repeat protein n=1 Tax=Reticulomyxa filosa TaxID=46433 RepID=X6P5W2_RETFI|nr:WD-40 repeat protein [Reticulomyxa filosa]|eukprot:ETO33890.1 WD-40 repeat protein [Reticulomyxa filosa]
MAATLLETQTSKRLPFVSLILILSEFCLFFYYNFMLFVIELVRRKRNPNHYSDGFIILTRLLSIMYVFFISKIKIQTFIYKHYLTQEMSIFIFDTFHQSSKLLNTFIAHTETVYSIDYATFDSGQYICSGSQDKTVRVWDIENNKQMQSFNGHSYSVNCVKFSKYYYQNYRFNVICSSSKDNTIRFWDFKRNRQLNLFNEHFRSVYGIEFSPFGGGRYLCSGSDDKTIRLWDVETSKSLHVFNGHERGVWCVDISPLQSNNNYNKTNSIGVIGGNGYTICSGSFDKTIRTWDIETTKELIKFKGHKSGVNSVKYGSNELLNTILSGSDDKSVYLWDNRSGKQTQVFNGHTDYVYTVEYSPFVVNNIEIGCYSNVICSGSMDNTICFWDIRSNKKELSVIKGDNDNDDEEDGILCLKFISLKKRLNTKNNTYALNLCYGSIKGPIYIWG